MKYYIIANILIFNLCGCMQPRYLDNAFHGLARDGWTPETAYSAMRNTYIHFEEKYPSTPVSRGNGEIPFEYDYLDLNSQSFTNYDGTLLSVDEALEISFTDAFLVIHRGKIVYEKYFNGMTDQSRHLGQSMTKSITGALAAILIEEGNLGRGQKVRYYLPDLSQSAYAEVTIQQLLDHTTAVRYGKNEEDLDSDAMRHQQAMGWYPKQKASAPVSQREFLRTIKRRAIVDGITISPGTHWDIHDANTEVLAWIIEKVSGKDFSQFLSDRIWSHIGAEEDALLAVDPAGAVIASSGLCATARDVGRFGQMMLQKGRYNGKQIVPHDWVMALRKIRKVPWQLSRYRSAEGMLGSYRDHWFQYAKPEGAIEAQGFRGQFLYIDPNTDTVIVRFATHPDGFDPWPYQTARTVMQFIANQIGKS